MTFLAPMWLVAAAGVSAAVVVLHFFARRRPNEMVLPTARFIPPHSAQSTTRTLKPNDLLLMALRVGLVMAVGAALAQPVLSPRRRARAGIVLADVSRATTSLDELRQRVARARREGDVVIPFDSAPRVADDSVHALSRTRGSLSAALLAALNHARTLGAHADSVELTIVSAMRDDELDRATPVIRALWPGRVTLELLSRDNGAARAPRVEVRAQPGDPLLASARLHFARGGTREVRIIRDRATTADSTWAAVEGHVLVEWPSRLDGPDGATIDSSGALIAGDAILIAPLRRQRAPSIGAVIARWADGRPAATEVSTGGGCIRSVAVTLPSAGDLVLRPEFGRLLRALASPCEGAVLSPAVTPAVLTSLAGSGALAAGRSFPPAPGHSALAPWLFALALLLAAIEPFVRRGRRGT